MLILEIAAGYLLGRLLLHLASLSEKVFVKMLLKHSSGFRDLIRKSRAEDEVLKRRLEPSIADLFEVAKNNKR